MHVDAIEDEGQYLKVILRVRLKKDWKWQDYTRWRRAKSAVTQKKNIYKYFLIF